MTGLPTLAVYLESAAGTFVTHDITAYVELASGWGFRRGRNDEDAEIEPATSQFVLTNRDGRFTLGAANYDGITVDKRIQVRETVGANTYTRFTGYVQQWPTEWDSALGVTAKAKITAVDRQSRLNRRKLLSMTVHEILADSPLYYWRLSEPVGSLSAGDYSGNGGFSLEQYGDGTAFAFGSEGPNVWDGLTSCTFAAGQGLNGASLWTPPSGSATFEFAFKCSTNPAVFYYMGAVSYVLGTTTLDWDFAINSSGLVQMAAPGLTSTTVVTDGQWHHFAVTISGTTKTLYIDGVQEDTVTAAMTLNTATTYRIDVGRNDGTTNMFPGSIAHVAVTNGALSGARVAAHADAVLTGFAQESSDARIARLADYAGIATADQALEAGVNTSIPATSISGQSVAEAMRAVVDAEGGVVFISGDGKLTFHNRAHRVASAVASPDLTINAQYIDEDVTVDADKDYLINTATGSRDGGAEQRVANQTSINTFDEYPSDHGSLLVTSDEEVLQLLNWQVNKYGSVSARVSSVTFDLMTLSQAQVQSLLALELGDYLQITGMPSQVTSTLDLIVEGIKEDQQLSDRSSKWEITFNTVPQSLFLAPIVDLAGATCDTGYPVYF